MSEQIFLKGWRILLITCLATSMPVSLFSKTYNINDFDAVPDGKTLITLAIQETMDKHFKDADGCVYVSAVTGKYHR